MNDIKFVVFLNSTATVACVQLHYIDEVGNSQFESFSLTSKNARSKKIDTVSVTKSCSTITELSKFLSPLDINRFKLASLYEAYKNLLNKRMSFRIRDKLKQKAVEEIEKQGFGGF